MWARYFDLAEKFVPVSSKHALKGEAGRLAVIGGCSEYSGAPFLAAMTALRLVHTYNLCSFPFTVMLVLSRCYSGEQ